MIKYYPALIHSDDNPGLNMSFVDFACISAGNSYEEVIAFGREAIAGHVGLMLENSNEIPAPSQIEDIDPVIMEDVDLIVMIEIELPKQR